MEVQEAPCFFTIDEGDRLGIVFPTDNGGTKIVYLTRNIKERVREVLDHSRHLSENLA